MAEQLTYQELATKIKSKYPQYKDMDDVELVDKIVEKYPTYGEILKKKEVGEEVSESLEEPTTSAEKPNVETQVSEKEKELFLKGLSDDEKKYVGEALEKTNQYYSDLGGMTPFQKMNQLNSRIKELQSNINIDDVSTMSASELELFENKYKDEVKQIVSDLGLQVNEDGSVTPYERELEEFKDRLDLNIRISEGDFTEEERKGFFGDVAMKLASGYERAASNVIDLVGVVTGLNYFDSYKDLSEGSKYRSEQLASYANRYDATIQDYIENGELGKAAGMAIGGAMESLPAMLPVLINPQYGLYVMSGMSGIDKYREIEDKDIPEWSKYYNAFITGASEYTGEKLVTVPILARSKQAIASIGEKRGRQAIENALKKSVENNASKVGRMPEWVAEGLSEVATGISTDIVDKVTINPNTKIGSHAIDDFTVGAVMGKMFSLPQDVARGINKLEARDFAKNVIDKLPADMDIESKIELGWKIAERDRLKEAEEKLDDSFKGKYTEQIDKLNSEITDISDRYRKSQIKETFATEPITDDEYNQFVDEGEVAEGTMDRIAEKVIKKVELSSREDAIFKDKTTEINKKIKDYDEGKVQIEESEEDMGKQATEEVETGEEERAPSETKGEKVQVETPTEVTTKPAEEETEQKGVIAPPREKVAEKTPKISFDAFVKDVISDEINLQGVDVGGLSKKQVTQAIRDINNGKESVAAKTLMDSLRGIYDSGATTIKGSPKWGTGQTRVNIPFDEFVGSLNISEQRQREIESELVDEDLKEKSKLIEQQTGIKPKNLRDVYRAGREVFGLNKVQALAQAVVVDRVVGKIASRQKTTKKAIYSKIDFRKTEGELSDGVFTPQTAKGALQVLEDGRFVVHALTNPNVSTPLHEVSHVYERYMSDSEKSAVLDWAGTEEWNVDTSEKFARGFEKYLAEGKAPNTALQGVFDRFKQWLTDIYNGIVGSEIDIELNDDMRRVYDSMLGEGVVRPKKRAKEKAKEISDTELSDMAGNITFQEGVRFQGSVTPEQWMNRVIDAAEQRGVDVGRFLRGKIKELNLPIKEEQISNILKERGHAQKTQKVYSESKGKPKGEKEKGEPLGGVREDDGTKTTQKKKKVSKFGRRFFTKTSQVPKDVQDLITEKGIHLYDPTSLKEAEDVSKEMAKNLSLEELFDIITSNKKMNEAVRSNVAIQTLKRLTTEISQAKKDKSPYEDKTEMQLEILRSLKDKVSSAGLLMRATQGDEFTEYLAPAAWVKDYVELVAESRRKSSKEKWFDRSEKLFKRKIEKAIDGAVRNTFDSQKVKNEIEKAKKRKPKEGKSEASKKRDDIVAKWKKSLEKRKTLFQAAKAKFAWMEEDIQFAQEVVQTYIEDGVYNRNVLAEKLSKQFEKLGLSVDEGVLSRVIPDEFNGVSIDELFEQQQLDKAAESLAKRIFGSVIETKKKDDPLQEMVNTLLSKFKERAKPKEVKKKTDLERVVDSIVRAEEYKETWKEARDLAIDKVDSNELLDPAQKELAKEKINNAYDTATKFTFTENQIRGVVRDAIRQKEINLDDLVRSHLSVKNATRETLKDFIIDSSGLDTEGAKILSDAVYGVYERMLTQRANNIIEKETKKMKDKASGKEVEKKIVATETERLLDLILLKSFEDVEFRDSYASIKGIPRISEDHVANIEKLAESVRETPSTIVKRMRKDDLLMYMRRLEGVSLQEALDTLWFASVLSGVTTQVRNAYGAFGNVYGDLFLTIASNPLKAADIIKSQSRGFRFGRTKSGVIWKTGKYFFENRTDAPMASEYAVDQNAKWTNPFKFAAYLMRFMSANDQLALSVGKEAYATLLANEQLKVNYFKKAFNKEYRKRINEDAEKLLGLSKEQLKEFDRIVKEESEAYGYDENEQKLRKQELIDEARPIEIVKDAETIASELTGNTKAYGTFGYLIEQLAKSLRNITVPIKVRGKKYEVHPLKLLAVFTKISTNVATTQLSFTPFGFMNVLAGKHGFLGKDNPFIKEMSPDKRRIHMARATAGTMLMGLMWGLMNPDDEDHWFQLTANGTGNYKDEAELRRMGWRPYSIFIGGYDGFRVSYRYTPFALLMAPLGYMSDRKRFTKKGKEKSEFELVSWAMTDVFTYVADNTPLRGMLNFMNNIIGGIRGASDMAEAGKDGGKAILKTFLNIPKGIYGAGIARSVIDTWDSFTRDERMENNKFYNDYVDRTLFEILPWEEDDFPARDSWGMPMKQYRTLDEFFGLRDEDQFASLREFHYNQGAGVVGNPNRNQLLFDVVFADGTRQAINLSRNNKVHRYLWNEVFLNKRGEYMRQSMIDLKNLGYRNEKYVEEFSKRKRDDQDRAKDAVRTYTLTHPLPISEKNKE